MRRWVLVCVATATACASATAPPSNTADTQRAAPPATAPAVAPPQPGTAPGGSAEVYDDPDEASDPATLRPLIGANETPTFPKGTADEHQCWQSLPLTGEARPDFDALVARCGTPTGAIEYAKPAVGKLHHALDKRDTYIVPVRRGLCYRFFGVGDATIPDLDILIERDGALQGEDKTNGPVAIIDSDKAWCVDVDGNFRFHVQVKNEGTGRYVFGVWARPKRREASR